MWYALGHILIYEGKWVKVEVRVLVFVEISVEVVDIVVMTQGKIDLRNESGRPMKVKVVGEVSEK